MTGKRVKIRIESPFCEFGGKVYIDNVQLPNNAITCVEYILAAGEVPHVTVTLIGDVEIDAEAILKLERVE